MAHRVLSHTADTGIEATAVSLPGLLEELLEGMFGLMADLEELAPERWVEATVEASSQEDLVVDTLSEALYQSEVEDLLLCAFQAKSEGEGRVRLRLGGVPMRTAAATGPAIKAVTYHELLVEQGDQGWYGRVYLDV